MARDRASRPEARPLRLFAAVDVPEPVRDLLAEAVAPLREAHRRARWVPPDNWHVTLKFLGSTYPRLVEWVHEVVAATAAAHGPVETSLEGLGAFPSPRRARVLWAGLADPGERLVAIAADLDRGFAREFRTEKRPFTPHLTVARFDPPAGLEDLDAHAGVTSEPWIVDRLVLYRSHLQRPAPRYEALETFELAG